MVFSTVHLLKNLARQALLDLGAMVQMDGTSRVVLTGQPVGMVGVTDIHQSGHIVSAGIWDSENKKQARRQLKITYHFANLIQELNGELPLDGPLWGVCDNCDALQGAIKGMGGIPINCKVHVSRNAQQSPGIVANGHRSRKDVVKEVRADLARLATNTQYSGVAVKDTDGPIASELTELFYHKWNKTGTDQYADTFKKEYMGERKGSHQQAYTNPGMPVHNNAIERRNLEFKNEGTWRELACARICQSRECFS